MFPVAAEKICKDIRHAVKPLWECCVAGAELAMVWRSGTDAGRPGHKRLSRRRVDFGDLDVGAADKAANLGGWKSLYRQLSDSGG